MNQNEILNNIRLSWKVFNNLCQDAGFFVLVFFLSHLIFEAHFLPAYDHSEKSTVYIYVLSNPAQYFSKFYVSRPLLGNSMYTYDCKYPSFVYTGQRHE